MSKKPTARDAREILLSYAPRIIETACALALGDDDSLLFTGDPDLLKVAFNKVAPKLNLRDDRVAVLTLAGIPKETDAYMKAQGVVDAVLHGKVSPAEASDWLSAADAYFTISEIERFKTALGQLEDRTSTRGSFTH